MHGDGGAPTGVEIRTFRLDPSGTAELDPRGRLQLRPMLAQQALVSALAASDAFWTQAETVRSDRDAFDRAGLYGSGALRRAVVGRLLFVAKWYLPSRDLAMMALDLTWIPVWRPVGSSRTTYRARPDFLERTHKGAEAIARRGASRCLACGTMLAGGARSRQRVRRDYCAAHEHDSLARWRVKAMDDLFHDVVACRDPGLAALDMKWAPVARAFSALAHDSESLWMALRQSSWVGQPSRSPSVRVRERSRDTVGTR